MYTLLEQRSNQASQYTVCSFVVIIVNFVVLTYTFIYLHYKYTRVVSKSSSSNNNNKQNFRYYYILCTFLSRTHTHTPLSCTIACCCVVFSKQKYNANRVVLCCSGNYLPGDIQLIAVKF